MAVSQNLAKPPNWLKLNHHSIRDIDQNLPNADCRVADVVLYRRHCDICASEFVF